MNTSIWYLGLPVKLAQLHSGNKFQRFYLLSLFKVYLALPFISATLSVLITYPSTSLKMSYGNFPCLKLSARYVNFTWYLNGFDTNVTCLFLTDNHFHKIKFKKTVLVAAKFGCEVYNVFIENSNVVFLYKFKYVKFYIILL